MVFLPCNLRSIRKTLVSPPPLSKGVYFETSSSRAMDLVPPHTLSDSAVPYAIGFGTSWAPGVLFLRSPGSPEVEACPCWDTRPPGGTPPPPIPLGASRASLQGGPHTLQVRLPSISSETDISPAKYLRVLKDLRRQAVRLWHPPLQLPLGLGEEKVFCGSLRVSGLPQARGKTPLPPPLSFLARQTLL